MIAYLISLTLFLGPVFLLFYMSFEIRFRNRLNPFNRLVSNLFLSTMLLLLGDFLISFIPEEHATRLILLLFYMPAFLVMTQVLRLSLQLTDKYRGSKAWLYRLIGCSPLLPGLYLLIPSTTIYMDVVREGHWLYQQPSLWLNGITLGTVFYSLALMGANFWAAYKHVKLYGNSVKKKQMRVLLWGISLSGLWAAVFSFYERPSFIPEIIGAPVMGMYAPVMFALFIRYSMVRYDFLPSVEKKYQILYDKSPLSILLLDHKGMIQDANPEAVHFFQSTPSRLLHTPIHELVIPQTGSGVDWKPDDPNVPLLTGDFLVPLRGKEKWVRAECEFIVTEGERFQYVVFSDITDMKAAEEKVSYLAYHDPLTGLGNRTLFHQSIHTELLGLREKEGFALILLDLDRFKQINDTYGHHVGDLLLRHVSEVLITYAPAEATITRLGGDEFAMIVPQVESHEEVEEVIHRLLEGFKSPFHYGDKVFHCSTSIGVCLCPEQGRDAEQLLQYADMAMYRAKKQGRNQYVIYYEGLSSQSSDTYSLDSAIRRGLEQGEFVLYYQPQLNAVTGQIVGAETIIRWMDPIRGLLEPEAFIPQAQESGAVLDMGYWVLETACKQLQQWEKLGLPPLRLSINMSGNQLMDPLFLNRLKQVLSHTGIQPSSLCIEIAERTMVTHAPTTPALCREISELGVQLVMDHYEMEYCSLSLLKRLQVDAIKLDRSLIQDITRSEQDLSIVQAIVTMCQGLGMRVTAAGVEEQAQQHLLELLGCDEIQGYSTSEAIDAEAFRLLLINDYTVGKKTWEEALINQGRRIHS